MPELGRRRTHLRPGKASVKKAASAVLMLIALLVPAGALGKASTASILPAIAITSQAATLQAQITPQSSSSSYYFEYGPTTAYGTRTPSSYVAKPAIAQIVQATVNGLTAGAVYHFRVVVDGFVYGGDQAFTTLAAAGSVLPPASGPVFPGSSTTGLPSDPIGTATSTATGTATSGTPGSATSPSTVLGAPGSGDAGGSNATAPVVPTLGQSVDASPGSGSVRVKLPGTASYGQLAGNAAIPVGSTVDSRHGSVNLVTALGTTGQEQSATFSGAVFKLRQDRAAGGIVDLYLRGGNFSVCRRAARSAVGAASAPRVVRQLWGHDHHGHFRTHGSHAIATVRGTTWVMADRCDGTLTSVSEGAVSVRDRARHKAVLVRAGHRYLAPARASRG